MTQRKLSSFQKMPECQPVGHRILSNLNFLKKLYKTKSERKKWSLLKKASTDELLALVEVCNNITTSNFCLTLRQKKKLLPHTTFLRNLSRVRTEKGARKIIQKGRGFPFVALLAPVLVEVARTLINKAIE